MKWFKSKKQKRIEAVKKLEERLNSLIREALDKQDIRHMSEAINRSWRNRWEATKETQMELGKIVFDDSHAPEPHTCPVCNGRGQMPYHFYTSPPTYYSSSTIGNSTVACRSCSGTGVLWRP